MLLSVTVAGSMLSFGPRNSGLVSYEASGMAGTLARHSMTPGRPTAHFAQPPVSLSELPGEFKILSGDQRQSLFPPDDSWTSPFWTAASGLTSCPGGHWVTCDQRVRRLTRGKTHASNALRNPTGRPAIH